MSVYAKIIKRTGMYTCRVRAYSSATPPSGEEGEINIAQIDAATDVHFMTADDFEKARRLNWPDQWK